MPQIVFICIHNLFRHSNGLPTRGHGTPSSYSKKHQGWVTPLMAERAPLFKDPFVVLLGTSHAVVSYFFGNVLCNATFDTNGVVSLITEQTQACFGKTVSLYCSITTSHLLKTHKVSCPGSFSSSYAYSLPPTCSLHLLKF